MQTSSAQQNVLDRIFWWWYAIAAPPAIAENISLLRKKEFISKRESVRKGKFTSLVLLIEILYALLAYSTEPTNLELLLSVTATLFALGIGILLNRSGKTFAAGILLILVLEFNMCPFLLQLGLMGPGLSPILLLAFFILVQPDLIAISLLPAKVSLLIVAYNCIFVGAALYFLPKTPELSLDLSISSYQIYYNLIGVPIFVSLISLLWANSALQEMKRADSSEEVSKLAQDIMSNPALLAQILERSGNSRQRRPSDSLTGEEGVSDYGW